MKDISDHVMSDDAGANYFSSKLLQTLVFVLVSELVAEIKIGEILFEDSFFHPFLFSSPCSVSCFFCSLHHQLSICLICFLLSSTVLLVTLFSPFLSSFRLVSLSHLSFFPFLFTSLLSSFVVLFSPHFILSS